MRRHVDSLRRFFELKAPEVAEDLTQATLLACVEASARFRGDASFKSFLFGIARRRLLLYLRSKERQERMHGFRQAQGPETVLTPSRIAALRQEQTAMLQGLSALPVSLQMTLQLYYWEGMKAGEIAKIFAVPASTITSRLARARELVRAQIEAGMGEGRARVIADDFDHWLRSLVR